MTVMTVSWKVVILAHRPYHRPIFSSSLRIAQEQSMLVYSILNGNIQGIKFEAVSTKTLSRAKLYWRQGGASAPLVVFVKLH